MDSKFSSVKVSKKAPHILSYFFANDYTLVVAYCDNHFDKFTARSCFVSFGYASLLKSFACFSPYPAVRWRGPDPLDWISIQTIRHLSKTQSFLSKYREGNCLGSVSQMQPVSFGHLRSLDRQVRVPRSNCCRRGALIGNLSKLRRHWQRQRR